MIMMIVNSTILRDYFNVFHILYQYFNYIYLKNYLIFFFNFKFFNLVLI